MGGVLVVLIFASLVSALLQRHNSDFAVLVNLRQRIKTWWMMSAIFVLCSLVGNGGSTILFALMSFMALREFITLALIGRI